MRPGSRAPQSILVTTGEEVTAIITPVSICMALTVALVKILNPTGRSDGHAVSIASVYYTEQVLLERPMRRSETHVPIVKCKSSVLLDDWRCFRSH